MATVGELLAGGYRLTERVGRGPHGVVFFAEQIDLGREVVVKIVEGDIDRQRLEREARLASALDDVDVVRVLEARLDHDPPFVVSERAAGRSLASLEVDRGRAIEIAMAMLAVLERAHAKGIFHGDLRPPNVFVHGTRVQLGDFGWEPERTGRTETATNLGAHKALVGYRAPERIEGAPADAASDVYAVGVCLYEMIARKRPFEAKSAVDEIAAVLGKPPPSLPGRAGAVVMRALAKKPSDRFQTAREMRLALAPSSKTPVVVVVAALGIAVVAALAVAFRWRPAADATATTMPDTGQVVAEAPFAPPTVAEVPPLPASMTQLAPADSSTPARAQARVVCECDRRTFQILGAAGCRALENQVCRVLQWCIPREPTVPRGGEIRFMFPQNGNRALSDGYTGIPEHLLQCFVDEVGTIHAGIDVNRREIVVHVR